MNTESSNTNRNINLDLLRILAALMVLTVHVGYEFPWIVDYTVYGYYGTSLFFVLSGYLAMKSMEHCDSILTFYKKRAVRIIPIYWSVLVISYLYDAIYALSIGKYSSFLPGRSCSFWRLRYFFFVQMFTPTDNFEMWNNRNALWTMSAFFVFYLIAPFIYKVIRHYYVSLAALAVLLFTNRPLISFIESYVQSHYGENADPYTFATFFPLSVMYAFFAGITVYWAIKNNKQMSLVILSIICLVYNNFDWFPWEISYMLIVLLAASVPGMTFKFPIVRTGIETFAKFSFALYLSHPFILGKLMRLKNFLVPIIRNKGFLAFVLAACILFAYLLWRFVEKPVSKLMAKWMHV